MNKISKLKNFNKILLGVIVFFAASTSVFALDIQYFEVNDNAIKFKVVGGNTTTSCLKKNSNGYNFALECGFKDRAYYKSGVLQGTNATYCQGGNGNTVIASSKITSGNLTDRKTLPKKGIPLSEICANKNFKPGKDYTCKLIVYIDHWDNPYNWITGEKNDVSFTCPKDDKKEETTTYCSSLKKDDCKGKDSTDRACAWYSDNGGKCVYTKCSDYKTKDTCGYGIAKNGKKVQCYYYDEKCSDTPKKVSIDGGEENAEDKGGNHTVIFDQYNGYGLDCKNGTSWHSPTACKAIVNSGDKAKFPVIVESNKGEPNLHGTEVGYGKLIGWDNDLDSNGNPQCQGGDESHNRTINKNAETAAITGDTTYKACYREYIRGDRYLSDGAIADGGTEKCGTQYYIDYCTIENDDNYCYGYAVSDTSKTLRKIYRNKIFSTFTSSSCTNDVVEEPKKEDIEDISNLKDCPSITDDKLTPGLNIVKYCYKKDNSNILKDFKCPSGYTMKNISNADGSDNCNDKYDICVNNFNITCSKGENAKPRLAVSSVIADSTGYGDIKVTATAQEGVIQDYYVSPYYVTPTDGDKGWVSLNGQTSFTYNSSPGVLFFWVRDSRRNISNAVSGAVFDTKNTDTTVKDLSLVDDSGNYQAPTRVSYNMDGVKDSGYVMMSNNLNKDSKVLADGFNPFDMQYELEVESPTITVYATLTSTDSSYVPGYEPRTVNLSYGMNTILIKIQNKEGKTRTYTILVTRKDTRTSDNTLSDISLSEGNITFNSNVTDYKVEIPKSTTSVNVNSTIASDKASYVSGYEPGNVSITGDTTVKLIKVMSETGSTRTYVITFVKEGTDVISKESLQLSDLVIPDAYIPFESDVANYSLSVAYETATIDINTVKKDKNSSVLISVKKKSDNEYKVVSDIGIGLDVGENFVEIRVKNVDGEVSYYRLTIIRKEFGLGISNDTALKELRVLGYDIDFEPNKKEYTVRIKQEKSLVVTAVPASNRAEVFIRGNEELTGFSTVRVKVVAENGEFETYSIDIKKDAFNKTIEIAAIVAGAVIILASSAIIIVKKKSKAKREYFEE